MAITTKAKKPTAKSTVKKTVKTITKKKAAKSTTIKKTAVKSKPTVKPQSVNKDMTIAEAVQNHPETAFVMMKHGLHCVGCHVASWETIEQGAMGHGMDEKGVKAMVDEMNQAIDMVNKKK